MKIGFFDGASALTVALVLGAPVHAQDFAAQDSGGLQEIVVTAQRRSESAQDVPIAISAVTGDALQAKGLSDIASISGQAPNVTLKSSGAFGGSSSTLYTYIRGIGQNDFAFNLEPGVGVYIDNVYLARNIGANVDLLDLERVEVLKGPQGTLFGRNTIGGALNIVTADPGNAWKYKGEVTTGRFDRIDVRASLEAPVIPDVLRLGFAFSTKHRDGYQKRIPYAGDTGNNPIWLLATGGASGGPQNTNTDEALLFPITAKDWPGRSGNQNQTAFRVKALFTPDDRLTVRLIGDYLNVDEQATPFSLLQVNQNAYVALYNTCISGNPGFYAPVAAMAGAPAAGVADLCAGPRGNPASPTGAQPSLESQAGQHLPYDGRYVVRKGDGSIDPDRSFASGANFNKIDNYGINGQIEYALTGDLRLKSITAYRRLESKFGVDIGGAPFSALNPTFETNENQLSEEVQLVGNVLQDRWKFVLGGYYFHEWGRHDEGVPFTGGLIQVYSPDNRWDTKSYAAFMHNNIEIVPDKIGITLGIRYTHDRKRFTGTQRDENAFGIRLFQLPPALVSPDPADPYLLYARAGHLIQKAVREVGLAELHRRNVDRDPAERQARLAPAGDVGGNPFENALVEGDRQFRILESGRDHGWRVDAIDMIVPAQQGFESHDSAGAQIDLRLVEGLDLIMVQNMAGDRQFRHAYLLVGAHLALEIADAAARLLRFVQRQISAFVQAVRILPVGRIQGDAYAGAANMRLRGRA